MHVRECNRHLCPIDCHVSEWSAWGACTKTCGGGAQTRTRTVTVDQSGGSKCPALSDQRACNKSVCPTDCQMTEWTQWSTCSISCGTGTHTRTRKLLAPPTAGGLPCGAVTETKPCNNGFCHVCSHVKCHFEEHGYVNRLRDHGKYSIRVQHARGERHGDHHNCKLNAKTSTCECICRSAAWQKVAPADRA